MPSKISVMNAIIKRIIVRISFFEIDKKTNGTNTNLIVVKISGIKINTL
jgi:hypothetical protein